MTYCLDNLFEKSVRERIYLKNVSEDTAYFCWQAWRAFKRIHTKETVCQDDLIEFVIQHKQKGIKLSRSTPIHGRSMPFSIGPIQVASTRKTQNR